MEDRMTAQQLKNSILQMAVQGKLVPQDPNDEPASVLLDRIRKEKEQLIKDGKIKKNKKESYIFRGADNLHYEQVGKDVRCIEDELPFEIPDSWEWCRLGNIGEYRKGPFGSSLTKSMFVPKSQNTVKVYEQKNAIQKNAKLGDYYITQQYFEQKMKSFSVHAGDIIVSCAGTIGETYVLPQKIEPGIINQALMRMRIYSPINVDYFLLYFDYIIKQTSIKNSKGSAIKNIPPFDVFKRILFPVPPLKEQNRIVNKIQEIEFLLKKYQIVEEQLYELNSNIKNQLKKSILQYAIEGKLVPQDLNDEPATVLLERMHKEKEKLIADKKIKKDKNESMIYRRDNSYYEKLGDSEICIDKSLMFDIPISWCWVRIKDVFQLINGDRGKNYPSKSKLKNIGNIPFISAVNIQNGTISKDSLLYLSEAQYKLLGSGKLKKNDFVFCLRGSLGKNCKYPYTTGAIASSLIILRKYAFVSDNYIELVLNSPLLKKYIDQTNNGTAQPNLGARDIAQYLIPLPPLNEQIEIYKQYLKITKLLEF